MRDDPASNADYCARCGEFAAGRRQWMFYNHALPAREFFCHPCLRRMRIYAWIGFSLLSVLVAILFGTAFWLNRWAI